MGKVVHLDDVREFISKTPAFRARDIELIVRDRNYTALLLHNLAKKGEVKRITKGWYSLTDDPVVSVFAFRPAYLGLQEALGLHNMWEQETNVVIVTPLRVRTGVRHVMGSNVVIHRIRKEYFFGFDYLEYGQMYLPVSDIEKTLLDLIYFNELSDSVLLKKILKRADMNKLDEYLQRYSAGFANKARRMLGE